MGSVTEVGSGVTHVAPKDSVIVSHPGTWTKSGIFSGSGVKKAPAISVEDTAAYYSGK